MDCDTPTIKYFVFLFNSLSALLGIGSIGVNCLALEFVANEGRVVCSIIIVLGSIISLISFLGCCGAVRDQIRCMWTYAVFLMLLIVANSVLLFGYISHVDGEAQAHKDVDTAWTEQLSGSDAMSVLQSQRECCGRAGVADYVEANLTVPASCYRGGDVSNDTGLFLEGCLAKLSAVYESAEHWVVILSWASLVVECLALVWAFVLIIHIRNLRRRAKY